MTKLDLNVKRIEQLDENMLGYITGPLNVSLDYRVMDARKTGTEETARFSV